MAVKRHPPCKAVFASTPRLSIPGVFFRLQGSRKPSFKEIGTNDANHQSACETGTQQSASEIEVARPSCLPPTPRCLRAGDDPHPQEAELGLA
jgi:hypothetical protein